MQRYDTAYMPNMILILESVDPMNMRSSLVHHSVRKKMFDYQPARAFCGWLIAGAANTLRQNSLASQVIFQQ